MEHLVVDGTDAELVRVVDGPREALHAVVDGLA